MTVLIKRYWQNAGQNVIVSSQAELEHCRLQLPRVESGLLIPQPRD